MGAGYSLAEILKLSLRQLAGFVELADRRKKADLITLAINQRVAYHGEAKDFEAYTGELTKE